MPEVHYGDHVITYAVVERPNLKAHYISIDRQRGVVLRGRALPDAQAARLIQGKARWILQKLALVQAPAPREAIVTGSRITYLGRGYYTEVVAVPGLARAEVTFNHSRFRVAVDPTLPDAQVAIGAAIDAFLRARAVEKLTPRVAQWARKTGLAYTGLRFRRMKRRWGSCSATDALVLNTEAIHLPYSLIDYLIVHELCHTRVKNHSRAYWKEVARYLPNWRELDKRLGAVRLGE